MEGSDPGQEERDHYAEFLRRTKAPEANEEDPAGWGPFLRRVAIGLVAAIGVVMFFQSDTPEARTVRSNWTGQCLPQQPVDFCDAVVEQWHDICYRKANGKTWFQHIPSRHHGHQARAAYAPGIYDKCMDGHARDRLRGIAVEKMLHEKQRAVEQHEAEQER